MLLGDGRNPVEDQQETCERAVRDERVGSNKMTPDSAPLFVRVNPRLLVSIGCHFSSFSLVINWIKGKNRWGCARCRCSERAWWISCT